jgi:hypothetical protein
MDSVVNIQTILTVDLDNISDPPLRSAAYNFERAATNTLTAELDNQNPDWDKTAKDYYAIIARCGQIIQGQN